MCSATSFVQQEIPQSVAGGTRSLDPNPSVQAESVLLA